MIYTITLNPAIDHVLETNSNLDLGQTNYYNSEYVSIGGKGINVAIVLNNLEANPKALGILGSQNKEIFKTTFKKKKLNNSFFECEGSTRINYKIKESLKKRETEFNGLGFEVKGKTITSFLEYLKTKIKKNDIVIATGSAARGVGKDIYFQIGNILNNKQAYFICDATNELLENSLKAKPYLIKPNLAEICETLNVDIKTISSLSDIANLVKILQKKGARNVLLSMGSKGSLYFDENQNKFEIGIAKGKLINSVGAGDSMLAGFTFGLAKQFSIEETLKYAAASGCATAYSQELAEKDQIEILKEQIKIKKI